MNIEIYEVDGQLTLLDPEKCRCEPRKRSKQGLNRRDIMELIAVPLQVLDTTPGHVDLLGDAHWEIRPPMLEDGTLLNTGVAPREPICASLSSILEPHPDRKYYLSRTACLGILRRADERGKELPEQLKVALMAQAGLAPIFTPPGCLKAYHINQRDEGIDLGGVSGALLATMNMQMQTFVTGEPVAFAGLSTGFGIKAGGINYGEEEVPTMKGSASDSCMSSFLCLNDQGGERMDVTMEQTTTLRAQAGGHQPLICLNDQGGTAMEFSLDVAGTLRAQEHGHQPLVLYENHGIDSRYTGPHKVAPTISARAGTGGNNLPLVASPEQEALPVIWATDNTIDHNAVFSRQRVDVFIPSDVVSTESARQHKDATDLVYQATVGALTSSDHKGPNSQYVGQDKLVVDGPLLIRRLTPLECERLQGFPDLWTAIPGAADSARYKALGNSVAIPCVEFIMRQIVCAVSLELAA